MRCPSCGRDVQSSQPRCPACGATAPAATGGDDPRTALGSVEPDRSVHSDDDLPTGDSPSAAAGPLEVGQVFASRYRIDELLGVGGMGAVYRAFDQKVEIPVALKVIRPEVAAAPEVAAQLDRRFRRELVLARQVTHRNVVRIHDLGEVEGIKYITMSYIEGEDLATILSREGHLDVGHALRIVRSVASGLLAAHEAGVVHRDLKPANIMIETATGEPYIMDFGIARSADAESSGHRGRLDPAGVAGDADSTRAGAVLGTLQYMAPEQFLGHEVDQRADVYALGLIFYDLLLGRRRAGSADSALAELRSRTETAPPPPRTVDSGVPEAVDRIIASCLEPDPDKRIGSSSDLAEALEHLDDEGRPIRRARTITGRLVAVAGAAVASLLVGTWWFASSRTPAEPPEPISVLVADLVNRTGDAAFDGAVEQALTIAMEGAGFINAYPRAAAARIADQLRPGSSLDDDMARLVSRREGIGLILASTLERDGQDLVLTVRALDPGLDAQEAKDPVASTRTRAEGRDDVLAAVGRAASELRGELGDTAPASSRLAAAETFSAASVDAMRAYARGQQLAAHGRFEDAVAAYREAVDLDPGFGRAWAGMAVVYGNLRRAGDAEASYQKALENLDRMSERERYRTLGGYYLLVSRNYEKAIDTYETLLASYPADSAGNTNLAFAALMVRDFDRALDAGRRAVELEPNSVIKRINYAMYAMYAGDFATAMEQSRVILEGSPGFGYALLTLARSAAASGDLDVAEDAYRQLGELDAAAGGQLASLGRADLAMLVADHRRAVAILEPAVSAAEAGGNAFDLASKLVALGEARLALGDREDAIRCARRAVELSEQESVLYPAARLLLAADRGGEAEDIADRLDGMLQTQTTAAAGLIRGERALLQGRVPDAVRELRASWQEHDWWFAHLLLGRAWLEAGHVPEALDELELCVRRKGEAADVFLVDGATLRYWPPALYWLGRAEEALGNPAAAAQRYGQYLSLRGDADPPDPSAADAAARLGGAPDPG